MSPQERKEQFITELQNRKEIINGQIDYAIQVLKSMFERIKGYNISTEEFNEILDRKIKKLESEKFDI